MCRTSNTVPYLPLANTPTRAYPPFPSTLTCSKSEGTIFRLSFNPSSSSASASALQYRSLEILLGLHELDLFGIGMDGLPVLETEEYSSSRRGDLSHLRPKWRNRGCRTS